MNVSMVMVCMWRKSDENGISEPLSFEKKANSNRVGEKWKKRYSSQILQKHKTGQAESFRLPNGGISVVSYSWEYISVETNQYANYYKNRIKTINLKHGDTMQCFSAFIMLG